MREILFRGKTGNGVWVEGYLCKSVAHIETFHQNVVVDTIEVYDGKSYLNIMYRNVDTNTIGQFAGLTDEQGNRIFEGDIVEPVLIQGTHSGFSWGRQVVVFDRGAFCLKNRRDEITPMCNYSVNVKFKVLGNIHDNPELIEVTA